MMLKQAALKGFYGLEREKIKEYDFCPHREYQVSHMVKSFQYTGSLATGS